MLTFTGSLAGSTVGAVAVAAGGVAVAASLAAVCAVTVRRVLGSAAFAAELGSAGLSIALAASGTVAVVSILKSPMVGGGTLAGSGRGTAASIASSAALARGVVDWAASAEVADTVRKVAATAISTRSNPARFVEQSRIVTPPWANCPGMEQSLGIVGHGLAGSAGSIGSQSYAWTPRFKRRRYMCPFMQPAPCGTTHDKLTSTARLHSGLCFCHAARLLSVTAKPRFESFRGVMSLVCHDLCHAGAIIALAQSAQFASPSAGSLAAASSSLR